MAQVLKHALRSLCTKTGWCYAVFWKLKRRSRMVLTWEDGHYDALGNPGLDYSSCRQMEDQINLAVAKMSFHVHSLGEGIIGRVAFTAKHQWIYGSGENLSLEKYPEGWSSQFAAGIKTIAVVAVTQGVVQLGSTQTMPEDLNLVGQIRALFGTLQSVPGAFVSDLTSDVQSGRNLVTLRSSPATVTTFQTSKDFGPLQARNFGAVAVAAPPVGFSRATSIVDAPCFTGKVVESGQVFSTPSLVSASAGGPTATFQTSPLDDVHCSHVEGLDNSLMRGGAFNAANSFTSSGYTRQPAETIQLQLPRPATTCFTPCVSKSGDFLTSNLVKPVVDSSSCSSTRQFGGSSWSPTNFGFEGLQTGEEAAEFMDSEDGFDYNSLFKALQKDDLDDFNGLLAVLNKDCPQQQQQAVTGTNFAIGDELSEALVPPFKCGGGVNNMLVPSDDVKVEKHHHHHPLLQAFELPSAAAGGAGGIAAIGGAGVTGELGLEKLPGYCDILVGLTDKKPEPLLDAVVAAATSVPSPCKPLTVPAFTSSLDTSLDKQVPADKATVVSVPLLGERAKWPCAAAALQQQVKTSGASSWIGEAVQSKKAGEETSSSSRKEDVSTRTSGRKRLRPGETPRPRPKDRQQIQDRVRELRDIVPNATKCSIDSLLEKTIKHMQFLQSVTQHGEKWKAGGDMKVGGILERHSAESGASWAMEVGGKGPCPIVVENLRQPGQMLVEMLCEEKGLFWEIADNIRNLGLTILKGVMESRNDKVWARFNVEMQASREVDRVKVLWNLVQLLRPNSKQAAAAAAAAAAASSFNGSEVTDLCSESLSGFQQSQQQQQQQQQGIMVSSAGW